MRERERAHECVFDFRNTVDVTSYAYCILDWNQLDWQFCNQFMLVRQISERAGLTFVDSIRFYPFAPRRN